MDRTTFAACAAGGLVLACAMGIAWHAPGVAIVPGRPLDAQPARLDLGRLDQCSWRPLEQSFIRPAPELTGSVASGNQPPVSAAEPMDAEPSAEDAANPDIPPRREAPARIAARPEAPADEPRAVTPEAEAEAGPMDNAPDGEPRATHMLLPWAYANPHTGEMIAVSRRAEQRVRYGLQLARRGALYSARRELIAGLQIIAQANDDQQNTRLYTKALSAGLTALREAGSFARQPADRAGLEVEQIVATHKTPVLKNAEGARLSPTLAAQRYYAYAQEQLGAAAAREVSGSMALFALGKMACDTGGKQPASTERTAQAIALYHAALLAEPSNYLAANELAVLEVSNGNLQRARELLLQSAGIAPQPVTWQNLIAVHARLGEKELARQAEARLAAGGCPSACKQPLDVEWLEPSEFSNTNALAEGLAAAPTKTPPSADTAPAAEGTQTASDLESDPSSPNKGLTGWLPWSSRRSARAQKP